MQSFSQTQVFNFINYVHTSNIDMQNCQIIGDDFICLSAWLNNIVIKNSNY